MDVASIDGRAVSRDCLEQLPDGLVLDGELVVPGADGRSGFEELRRRNLPQRPRMIHEAAATSPAVLVVFDILEAVGEDLRALPLLDRRRALREHIEPGSLLQLIEHVETHGEALFHEADEMHDDRRREHDDPRPGTAAQF